MNVFQPLSHPLDGTHLIEASAGTGKTYSITLLVLRLIVEKAIPIDEILVVTFTESATSELKQKIYQRLSDAYSALQSPMNDANVPEASIYREICFKVDEKLAQKRVIDALQNFDRAKVFTIHGFCHRMLMEQAFETGVEIGIELTAQNDAFFNTLAKDFWLAYCFEQPLFMVSFFINHKLSISLLSSLARKIYATPDLKIIANPGTENMPQQFRTAFLNSRKLFLQYQESLLDAFHTATGLNKNKYKRNQLPSMIDEANVLFGPLEPAEVPNKDARVFRFSASQLQEASKGDLHIECMPFFDSMDIFFNATCCLDGEIERLKSVFVEYVRTALPKRKQSEGLLFFDDLLQKLDAALQNENRDRLIRTVSGKFKAALIDEFQDTDAVQYRIFKQLFMNSNVPFFIIGDPKQAIYSFRGGDIYTYMNAADAVAKNRVSLGTNWRSSDDLVTVVNGLFQQRDNPFLFHSLPFFPVQSAPDAKNTFRHQNEKVAGFQFLFCKRDENICSRNKDGTFKLIPGNKNVHVERACDDIAEMLQGEYFLGDKPISPSDIAVLVRKNSQGQLIYDELRKRNIFSVVSGTDSVYQSLAAAELHQLLTAIISCRVDSIKVAVSTHALGVKGARLLSFLSDEASQSRWQKFFIELKNRYENNGMVAMFSALLTEDSILHDGGFKARVLRAEAGNQYLVDFLHLLELLQREFGGGQIPLEQLIEVCERRMQQPPDGDEHLRRPAHDGECVQIVTIHKSKGLQYPVVYLPFVFSDGPKSSSDYMVYHRIGDNSTEYCDLRLKPDDAAVAQFLLEQQAEQMRLLYVALTRAKQVCKVIWGAFNGIENAALSRLLYTAPKKNMASYTDEQFLEPLLQFCEFYGAELYQDKNIEHGAVIPDVFTLSENLSCRSFTPNVITGKKLRSFSALTRFDELADDSNGWNQKNDDSAVLIVSPEAKAQHESVDIKSDNWLGLRHEFSKGTAFGSCIHEILEHWSTHKKQGVDLRQSIESILPKYGFHQTHWAEHTPSWLHDISVCNLDENHSFSLQTISGDMYPEMEFMVPVSNDTPFCADSLRSAMLTEATVSFQQYAQSLDTLSFDAFSGYLKGFIDLIFTHEKKFYILDYKTNDLGSDPQLYRTHELFEDMAKHHYFLQYHIYAAALHRYLKKQLPQYRYNEHFGGVFYLYIRGMSSIHGCEYGVFFDKPPISRLDALDSLFGVDKNQTNMEVV